MRKRYVVILSLVLLVVIIGVLIIVFRPKKPTLHPTVNVFGAPRAQTNQNFPATKSQFTAVIGKIKPASVNQQSIAIYKINSKDKVFERSFYADGFRGNDLTYLFATNSAEITQSGIIGTLGCNTGQCVLLWSNYYAWDSSQHTFILNNANHKNEFEYLLADYQALDQKGCGNVKGNIIPDQMSLSFTQLYKKFPTAKYYCSNEQGILPSNIIYFLQAEKTLQNIVNGVNTGSADIRDIQM